MVSFALGVAATARIGRGRTKTSTFTCTFRLDVAPDQATALERRFDAARRLFNACLAECRQRATRMRESRLWTQARKSADGEQRRTLFRQARQEYGFRLYDLFAFVASLGHGEIGHHLDSATARGIATRAFAAVEDWVIALRGRPRDLPRRRGLRSLGGAEHQGILFRTRPVPPGADPLGGHEVRWKGLVLPVRFRHGRGASAHAAAHRRTIEHALSRPIKFVRILRKIHGTEVRYYAQLVLEGQPLTRSAAGEEAVGWDLGVSSSAWVGETQAHWAAFAPGLADYRRRRRRLQRRVDRQRRAGNPEHYLPDGTIRPGRKRWKVSGRQAATQGQLADVARRQAEQRRNENNGLANRIVQLGRHVQTEDVHVRSWTRLFGAQIGRSAPAGALAAVVRKAESAGGSVLRLPLRLGLSQTCVCGARAWKPLSQRVHICARCGLRMQRDLLSAYLARCCDGPTLHADHVREAWSATEPLLRTAWGEPESARPPGAATPPRHRCRQASVRADRARDRVRGPLPASML